MKKQMISSFSRVLQWLFPQLQPPKHPHKIIVIKPCCLGDVVLATATIAAIRYYYPQAVVDFAVGSWSQAVLANNVHLHQLIDSGDVGQGRYGWLDVWHFVQRLRQNAYDLAIVLDRSPLVGLVPWLAGIRHRVGLDSYGRGFAHTLRVPVPDTLRHEAVIYLACVAAAVRADLAALEAQFQTAFYPTARDQERLPNFERPIVILHPSGGVNPGMQMLDKRWPSDRFAALADRLGQRGYQVVLTGVIDDLSLCQQIAAQIVETKPQILAGSLSLPQFGALCQQAHLFVGGDTGAMHLAVACGCNTVAIFGPSHPGRYSPFGPSTQVQTLWRAIPLPIGGVGQGRVADFSWTDGVTVDEAWLACQYLLQAND